MPPKPPHQSIIQTEFDERTIGTSTQLLKALIPFLEPSQQKMFGLMVRIIEFNMTLDFFNHNRIPACAFKPPCGGDMLSELKNYCSPEEKKQLDMILSMIKAQKIQAALAASPPAGKPSDSPPAHEKPPSDNPTLRKPPYPPPPDRPHGKPSDTPPPCDCKTDENKPDNKPDKCPPPKPPNPPCQPSPIDMLSGFLSPEQIAMCRKFEDLL